MRKTRWKPRAMAEISWDQLTEENISALDREALQRALDGAHLESPQRSKQLTAKLQRDGWIDTAQLACSIMQAKSLGLLPHQARPYAINLAAALREPFGAEHGRREGADIVQRLLVCGLSRYEPDPDAALRRVERAVT
jgi:hypothetical protein